MMTIQECYAAFGGDYQDVMARLMTEDRVQRFVLRFLSDKSYDDLCAAMDAGDIETAFRAAHTLKGVCQNLSFTQLYESSHAMTELLRGGDLSGAQQLQQRVAADYGQTRDAIQALQNSLNG